VSNNSKKDRVVPVEAMKTYMRIRGLVPVILNLDSSWSYGQLHVPAALPPETDPGTHFVGGSMCPKTGLEVMAKIEEPFLRQDSNLQDWPVRSLISIQTTLSRLRLTKTKSENLRMYFNRALN
jgi:hypothetical protein